MSHDKIRAATRKRMAETGELYAVARRKVIRAGMDKITAWLDTLVFRTGPGVAGVEVDPGQIRIRMGDFKLTVPRSSVRSVTRSQARLRGTTGVHAGRGRLLVNGSAQGPVELAIDPPCHTGRTLSTMYIKEQVNSLILSLADPDGFIAAVEGEGS